MCFSILLPLLLKHGYITIFSDNIYNFIHVGKRKAPSFIDKVSNRVPRHFCDILQFADIDKRLVLQPSPNMMLFVIEGFHSIDSKVELSQMYAYKYIIQN